MKGSESKTGLMLRLAVGLMMFMGGICSAEENPLKYTYTADGSSFEITLHEDVCDKSDASKGYIAEAKDLATGETAPGCWHYFKFDTYLIQLDRGDKKFLDYELYRSKFKR